MIRLITRACLLLLALPIAFACGSHSPTAPSAASGATPQPELSGGSTASVASTASGPRNSEQVVFSGNASVDSTFAGGSSVGFWIWCEAKSTNPYAGECNGAMSFRGERLTRHVEDANIIELAEGIYLISVTSTRDSSIACTLINAGPPVSGPRNTVHVECQTPAGGATSTNAVVNVTGPGH
jgi:hypothetical protein